MRAFGFAATLSLVAHGGLYLALHSAPAVSRAPQEANVAIEVAIVTPAAKAPPPVQEKPPPPARKQLKRRPVKKPPEPESEIPIVAAEREKPPVADAPAAVARVGITEESTAATATTSVAVGSTLLGNPGEGTAAQTLIGRPPRPENFVPPSQVDEMPVLLEEVLAPYPRAAREAGIAGKVVLLLTIDMSGAVVEARRISGPGHGLDEAAIEAVKRFRFSPARSKGNAVATTIRYAYSFSIQ